MPPASQIPSGAERRVTWMRNTRRHPHEQSFDDSSVRSAPGKGKVVAANNIKTQGAMQVKGDADKNLQTKKPNSIPTHPTPSHLRLGQHQVDSTTAAHRIHPRTPHPPLHTYLLIHVPLSHPLPAPNLQSPRQPAGRTESYTYPPRTAPIPSFLPACLERENATGQCISSTPAQAQHPYHQLLISHSPHNCTPARRTRTRT
jgi:hypothetical protein